MNDLGLTVFDLKKLKGERTIKFVQVDTLEQAIAAKEAGIEMIGTGYTESKSHFPTALEERCQAVCYTTQSLRP